MVDRVLVIRPGALGDIILTLPMIQALVRARKQASVELLGNRPVIEWLVERSAVSSVQSFDRRDVASLFTEQKNIPHSLTEYLSEFDLVLSYAGGEGSGLSRNLNRLCRQVLELDVRPGTLPAMPMADYLQRPLARLGIEPTRDAPRISLLPEDRAAAADRLRARHAEGRRLVAVHPGSGSRDKNWPPERFAEVIRACAMDSRSAVMVIRGAADDSAAEVVAGTTRGVDLLWLDQPSLPLLAALLELSEVYVGNDSGVSHLAAAMGTPSVVLLGPSDPVVWAPRGPAVSILRADVDCAPCTTERRRSCADHLCLEAISVDDVLAEMERVGKVTSTGDRQHS